MLVRLLRVLLRLAWLLARLRLLALHVRREALRGPHIGRGERCAHGLLAGIGLRLYLSGLVHIDIIVV